MPDEVRWRDADRNRSVLLRKGLLGDAPAALAGEGWTEFELLSTERALEGAPGLADAAAVRTSSRRGRSPRWPRRCSRESGPRIWSPWAAGG